MSPRVYVLLDVTAGKSGHVARTLRRQPSVLLADEIEDSHQVIMALEAPSRQRLAKLTIQALSSVESMTDGIQLLPAKNGRIAMVPARFLHQHIANGIASEESLKANKQRAGG